MTATLPSRPLARLKGHTGPIHALTYSAGAAAHLLSGGADRSIILWSAGTRRAVQTYSGAHSHGVLAVAVGADNARFASGGGDRAAVLWDVATGRALRRFGGDGGRVEAVAFGGPGDAVLLSAGFDAAVRLWDTKAPGAKPMMVLGEAGDSVTSVVVRDAEIWAGSVDGRVRGYDVRVGSCHVDVLGHPVTSLQATQTSDALLVSTLDSTLRLMDTSNGKLLQAYTHSDYSNTTYRIRSVLGANDSLALAGDEDGWIHAWDVLSGAHVGRVRHAEQSSSSSAEGSRGRSVVSALAYKRKAEEWASAGGDGEIVIWGPQAT